MEPQIGPQPHVRLEVVMGSDQGRAPLGGEKRLTALPPPVVEEVAVGRRIQTRVMASEVPTPQQNLNPKRRVAATLPNE